MRIQRPGPHGEGVTFGRSGRRGNGQGTPPDAGRSREALRAVIAASGQATPRRPAVISVRRTKPSRWSGVRIQVLARLRLAGARLAAHAVTLAIAGAACGLLIGSWWSFALSEADARSRAVDIAWGEVSSAVHPRIQAVETLLRATPEGTDPLIDRLAPSLAAYRNASSVDDRVRRLRQLLTEAEQLITGAPARPELATLPAIRVFVGEHTAVASRYERARRSFDTAVGRYNGFVSGWPTRIVFGLELSQRPFLAD